MTKPDSLAEAKGPSFSKNLVAMLRVACGLPPTSESSEKQADGGLGKAALARENTSFSKKVLRGDVSKHSKAPLGGSARKLVALACSTGGPKALQYVVPFLPANLDAAVLIVQHMPEGFTASLSSRLDELSRIKVQEAAHGERLEKGTVYIAKGGSQLRLIEKGKKEHSLSVTVEPAGKVSFLPRQPEMV